MKVFNLFLRDSSRALRDLKHKPAWHWGKMGEKMAWDLFRYVYRTVPAYKKFLKKSGLNRRISTFEDFSKLPITDKNNYLRAFDYLDLFPYRRLIDAKTFSATSGSTGEPFYFPRSEAQDRQYEYIAELFLKNQFDIDRKSTLGVVGFGMGVWIGGIFTYKNFNRIAAKGHEFSLVPVGTNKDIYLTTIKKFGHLYDQIVLMGYPPFIKDIIDEGRHHKINWRDYNIRILTAAEGFSEKFRNYLSRYGHLKNKYQDIINIYGTVELGTMAHETALTSLIMEMASNNNSLFRELFPDSTQMPTLGQYHPYLTYFEQVEGEVIATGYGSSIPLLRYRFPDRGGVIRFDNMIEKLRDFGIDINRETKLAGISKMILKLPFVYVYERSDFARSLAGIIIYPEYIRNVLQVSSLSQYITGKFTMSTKNDRNQNQYLEINIELKKGEKKENRLKNKIVQKVVDSLKWNSTEYNHLYSSGSEKYKKQLTPKILLWPYEHSAYFKPGTKQKWSL